MHFILNPNNNLDYIELSPQDTIQSICDTLQIFLNNNPLDCDSCQDSCCRLFPIRPDNVFIKQPSFPPNQNQPFSLKNGLVLNDNQYTMPMNKNSHGLFCKYGNSGKCSIYPIRPVLCRLYTCLPSSEKWSSLLNIIVQAYKNALEYEIMEQTVKSLGSRGIMPELLEESSNPTLYANDYSAQIGKLLEWAQKNSWNSQNINFYN